MNHTLLPGFGLHRKKGLVLHAGTYIGEGRVMHLGPDGLRIDSLSEFAAGEQVLVVANSVPFHVLQERVAEALRVFRGYSAIGQNCEHLANFLQRGVKESPQVQGAMLGGLAIAGAVKGAGGGAWGIFFGGMFGAWLGAQVARP